jgi:hypothetical protein
MRGPGQRSTYRQSLRAARSGARMPVEAKFPHSSRTAAGPTLLPVWVPGLFPRWGIKRPRRGVGHSLASIAEAKEGVELHHYTPSGVAEPVTRVEDGGKPK